MGARNAGIGLDAGVGGGGGVAGTVGRIMGARSVARGTGAGLGTEGWRRVRGTAAVGWKCERVAGRLRDERRSTGRGEGMCPVTVAMASEGGASGSCITALDGG